MNIFKFLETSPSDYISFIPAEVKLHTNSKRLESYMFDMLSRNLGEIQIPAKTAGILRELTNDFPYLTNRDITELNLDNIQNCQILDVGAVHTVAELYSVIYRLKSLKHDCLFICSGNIPANFFTRWQHALAGKFYIDNKLNEEPCIYASARQVIKALGLEK